MKKFYTATLPELDAPGRLVERQLLRDGQVVEAGHLPDGFYFLKLVVEGRPYVGRFIKQH